MALARGIGELVNDRRPCFKILPAERIILVHLCDIAVDVRDLGDAALVVLVVKERVIELWNHGVF